MIGPEQTRQLRPFPLTLRVPMPYRAAATDRVRYVGEPVAVVVAASRHVAEDAAELVEVGYEPLDAVVDVGAAMASDAPRLHAEAESNTPCAPRVLGGAVGLAKMLTRCGLMASAPVSSTSGCFAIAPREGRAAMLAPRTLQGARRQLYVGRSGRCASYSRAATGGANRGRARGSAAAPGRSP